MVRLLLRCVVNVMVIIPDVVAAEIALMVVDQRLEIEVWQLVHDIEHDVFQELIIKFRCAGQDLEIATVLR